MLMRKPGVPRSPPQQDRAPCHRKPQDFPALGGLVLGPAALTPPRGLAEKCDPARPGRAWFKSSPADLSAPQVELVATITGVTWKLGVNAQPRSSTILSVLLCYNLYCSNILRTSQPVPRDLANVTGCFRKWNLVGDLDNTRQSDSSSHSVPVP